MLTLPRAAARAFRTLARKCVPARSRGPAPAVLIRADGETLSFLTATGDVTLRYTLPHAGAEGSLVVPITALEDIEGGADAVEFVPRGRGKALARWSDRGVTREIVVEILPAKQAPALPALPEVWGEATSALLVALFETGRVAGRETGRYATHRIQVRGDKGQVLATDCLQALILNGLAFPFSETLHVPAVPVFAAKELADQPVRVGRTDTHLAVEAGPWTVWLAIDPAARYPEVEAAVPRAQGETAIVLSETDAALLLDRLPRFPGRDGDCVPVTLAVDDGHIAGPGGRGR